ncbi:hypothetical protein QYF61_025567 [Mycteria americana]|uniref:ribonuclease H n=1 Tax=Mycteria americana TaxID=33587 RepID=A0AAN7N2B7_MYCAM|nr:hypothetical protein QYF61_025567 [Mycteria americana]
MPSSYIGAESICISGVAGGSQQLTVLEAKASLTGNEWQKHPIVTGPEALCILGTDYLRREYVKDPKGYWWAEDPSAVGLLRVKEQQVPIATTTVHRRQYCTNRDSLIPNHKPIHRLESQGSITECRPQFAFTWRGVQYTWNQLPQGWKHICPTICHGLVQMALEQGEAPEHLQYIDDIIVWGNTEEEVFEKGKKIVQILLKAGVAIKQTMEGEQLATQRQSHLGCCIVAKHCCLGRELGCKSTHVDAHVPKSRATEEHQNNQQVDQAAKMEVAQVDLDWQHKGELFIARWAHDTSGHQGRDATYRWARDRGVDLTMDTIAQVIHERETCTASKQAKQLKPLWYGGRWLKY